MSAVHLVLSFADVQVHGLLRFTTRASAVSRHKR